MDEDDIWLGENDEDECAGSASNESGPTFFNIELTQQGQPGGKRTWCTAYSKG